MAIKLKITWDGDVPGLKEQRLSLAAFAEPLSLLVKALRRTASGIIAQAQDDPSYGARGGSHRQDALRLDLAIEGLSEGSTVVNLDCLAAPPPPGVVLQLWDDLPRLAADRLLSDIFDEAKSHPRSSSARKFLRSLPIGLTAQKYTLYDGGALVREVAFGHAEVADVPNELPSLVQAEGDVVGVGFPPGDLYVELRIGQRRITCSATAEQVDLAIALRSHRVLAMVLDGDPKPRLLWLRDAAKPLVIPDPARRTQLIAERWNDALDRLAK